MVYVVAFFSYDESRGIGGKSRAVRQAGLDPQLVVPTVLFF